MMRRLLSLGRGFAKRFVEPGSAKYPLAVVVAIVATLVPAGTGHAAGPDAAGAVDLAWGPCPPPPEGAVRDPRQRCATLAVPLDHRRPRGRTIDVEISRIVTSEPGRRRGILLSNPGGPGGSGLDLPSALAAVLPVEVLARYDLIGFDPRGIGHSTPVTCDLPADTPTDLLLPYPTPDGSIDRNVRFARDTARRCIAESGDVLPYITTANTARDMDRIRAALGERRLSFYGLSYGSYLGAVYTSLYPGRSDRIVLDSAVDPRLWSRFWPTWSEAVALRFPDAAAWVADRDDVYGLGGTAADVTAWYLDAAAELDRDPYEVVEGLVLTGNLFREITRGALYSDAAFPDLADLWVAVANRAPMATPDAAVAAARAPAVASGVPPDNSIAALYGIVCGDDAWPRTPRLYARQVRADRRAWPLTAGMPDNIWPCAFWKRPVERTVRVDEDGPRNVLILQNERDPATSLASALGLRQVLGDRAAMVTLDHGNHMAYGLSPCVDAITHAFLASGDLPARDRSCPAPDGPAATARAGPEPQRIIPAWPLGPATAWGTD
jgi:pimeloyl-ACP methyl ester carboxylesterase